MPRGRPGTLRRGGAERAPHDARLGLRGLGCRRRRCCGLGAVPRTALCRRWRLPPPTGPARPGGGPRPGPAHAPLRPGPTRPSPAQREQRPRGRGAAGGVLGRLGLLRSGTGPRATGDPPENRHNALSVLWATSLLRLVWVLVDSCCCLFIL